MATAHDDAEIVVGVAYYVREAQEQCPTAEPGILVEDRFQDQGDRAQPVATDAAARHRQPRALAAGVVPPKQPADKEPGAE